MKRGHGNEEEIRSTSAWFSGTGVAGQEQAPLRWVVEDIGTIGGCNQGGCFLPQGREFRHRDPKIAAVTSRPPSVTKSSIVSIPFYEAFWDSSDSGQLDARTAKQANELGPI